MDRQAIGQRLEDFNRFDNWLDIKAIIAAADATGAAEGYEKELYALAIARAAQHGDFGDDPNAIRTAISALWWRGCQSGFSRNNFNAGFEEYFRWW